MYRAYNRYFGEYLDVVASYEDMGRTRLVYEDLLTPFSKTLKERIKKNYQNTIAVVGPTGTGKSTVAIQMCMLMDSNWDLSTGYIYGTADFKRALQLKKKHQIYLMDEASVCMNSANSQRRDDKDLVVIFDTFRSFSNTSFLCSPSLYNINKRIRENHLDYLLVCPAAAPIAGYSRRGFVKLYKHIGRDFGKPYFKLLGTSLFHKLPKKVDAEYQRIKEEHQWQIIDNFIKEDD